MQPFKQPNKFIVTSTLFVVLISIACKKPGPSAVDFEITGYKDVALGENGAEAIPLSVTYKSGDEDQVTLSLDGLPEGVSCIFSPETDKPSFTSSLYLKDDSSKGGIYPIKLTGKSSRGAKQTYEFQLTTVNKICASRIAANTYIGTSMCRDGKGESMNAFQFKEDTAHADRLLFTWNNHPVKVYMIVNCNRMKVTIPRQDVGSFKIEGAGYIQENNSIIHFDYLERHNNGDTVSCTAHFVKK